MTTGAVQRSSTSRRSHSSATNDGSVGEDEEATEQRCVRRHLRRSQIERDPDLAVITVTPLGYLFLADVLMSPARFDVAKTKSIWRLASSTLCRECRKVGTFRDVVGSASGQVRLATVRVLGSAIHQSHRLGSVEDVLVALSPVGVTVLPVAMQNVEVTGDHQAFLAAPRDQDREVGEQPMSGPVGKDQVASVGAGLPVRVSRSHREQVLLTSMHISHRQRTHTAGPKRATSPSAGSLTDLPWSGTLLESRTTHVLLSVVHPSVRHFCWGSGEVTEARS